MYFLYPMDIIFQEECKMHLETDEYTKVLDSLNKTETVVKVLEQTIFENNEFNAVDSRNLCSVLLREINYAKNKLKDAEFHL